MWPPILQWNARDLRGFYMLYHKTVCSVRQTSGLPSEETFLLEKLDPFTSATEVKIGQTVPLRLTIWLPADTTTLAVELLTPYASSAVLTICDPHFAHVGDNYASFDSQAVTPQYHAHGHDARVSPFNTGCF